MLADDDEKPTQFNQFLTVQPQNIHRSPTDSSYADDLSQVFAPTKMFRPFVLTRIEEPNQSARFRVAGMSVHCLETVAAAR